MHKVKTLTMILLGGAIGAASLGACDDDDTRSTMSIRLFESAPQLPGLLIEIDATGSQGAMRTRQFTLNDFTTNAAGQLETSPFSIPESGRVVVGLSLEDEGETIASGAAEFDLQSGRIWTVDIFRAAGNALNDCIGCLGASSIAIAEDAQNTPGEKIWIVWAVRGDENSTF